MISCCHAGEQKFYYETDVRPILKANCFHCHGEKKELEGGLDLRLKRLILKGGDSGSAIVPGNTKESLLLEYVREGDMPPNEELKLTEKEIDTISSWISQGALTKEIESETDPEPGELIITASERSHWAYRPIQKPDIPAVEKSSQEISNPIDAFIARKLSEKKLWLSERADKVSLIRRASFDLTGLPPDQEDVDEFLSDSSPNSYEKLIDRLLASHHYGERWGRHWLDVAGYADSEGYNDRDLIRQDAWSYRDYVIRSFNADKPWNQFITEQLAGDELVSATQKTANKLANSNLEALEKLTATGFLRMGPDGTGSSPMDLILAQKQVITETLKIVSSSLLGTTIGCAECHHHRYDPIPQEDFYRMRAIFAPVYDTESWLIPKKRQITIFSEENRKRAEELESKAKEYDHKHNTLKNEVLQKILNRVLEEIPEEKRDFARKAFETPREERTEEQIRFIQEEYPMVGLLTPGSLYLYLERFKDGKILEEGYEEAKKKAQELRNEKPKPVFIRVALENPDNVPETFLYYRGDYSSPQGNPLSPAGLTLFASLQDDSNLANSLQSKTTGRRLDFAHHLTSGKHPLVARVLVNRFWHHHFGRGLVESTGDFGTQGMEPSHPELLDWLAIDFMENGWKLKRLHKMIMTSKTYCQSSVRHEKGDQVDTQNRLLWRMPVRRLEAEVIRDSILLVSGELNREMFGPPVPVEVNDSGIFAVGGGKESENRQELKRSVYIQMRRNHPVAMLQAFDSPQMEPNCERRVVSTVPTQSLAMLNSQFIVKQADAFAERVLEESGVNTTVENKIHHVWKLAYNRAPSSDELKYSVLYLTSQTDSFVNAKVGSPEIRALSSMCQVLLCSNEFLYVD